MALGFCMVNAGLRESTVRISCGKTSADLTSGEVAATATLHRLLGLRSRGPTAVSASLIRRFDLCFRVGSGVASGDCASGAGSATGSAVPLITFLAGARRELSRATHRESRQLLIGWRGSRERHRLGTSLNHVRRCLPPRQEVL